MCVTVRCTRKAALPDDCRKKKKKKKLVNEWSALSHGWVSGRLGPGAMPIPEDVGQAEVYPLALCGVFDLRPWEHN